MGYTYKVISLDPERGFEPQLRLLTENVDYKATALPSELSSFYIIVNLKISRIVP